MGDTLKVSAAATLRIGSTGTAVKTLQQKLGITADGIYGSQTAAAVKAYQTKHGLVVDGIAGPQTLSSLGLTATSESGTADSTNNGAGTMSKADQDEAKAASFGWSIAVINSNPDLKQIFEDAISQNYTTDMFIAKVRDTPWFKTHTDTWRQAFILQKTDPSTWNNKLNQSIATLQAQATKMGATLTAAQLRQFATDSLMFGWNPDQTAAHLTAGVMTDQYGNYHGDAGAAQYRFNQMVRQYGVSISAATLGQWVKQAAAGQLDDSAVRESLISQAASRYPALAERLRAGQTMEDIAQPYLQSYGRLLEVNPDTVTLQDPMLQQAFAAKDAKGQPAVQTVWQFEQNLRNDPRWLKTQNAQDSTMSVAHRVLQDMGLMS